MSRCMFPLSLFVLLLASQACGGITPAQMQALTNLDASEIFPTSRLLAAATQISTNSGEVIESLRGKSDGILDLSLIGKTFLSDLNHTNRLSSLSETPRRQLPSPRAIKHLNDLQRERHGNLFQGKSVSANNFSCQSMPSAYSPFLTCSGVADYAFYVPYNVTLDEFDQNARAEAAYANSFLSSSCLSDIKRLICARIYKPCVAGVVPGDTSTYGVVDSIYKLPYHRPCQSLCIAASFLGSTCGGLFEALGGNANCWASDPVESAISLFDSSDNSSTCNSLPSVQDQQIVSDAHEPYVGEICKGIVYDYYVPSPASVSSKLAPLLPPYVLQSVVEATVTTIEGLIPMYLETPCLHAQRKIMCALQFMPSSPNHLLDAVFGTVYLPSLPHHDLCTTYQSECSYLIGLVPALSFNCSAVLGTSMRLFPETTQTIVTLDLGYGPMALQSPPNTLPNASYTLSTQCPYGFAVPNDPHYPGTTMIHGTGCATQCPIHTSSREEYAQVYRTALGANIFAIVMIFMAYFNIYVTSAKKRNIFMMIILTNLLIPALMGACILLAVDPSKGYSNVCSTETAVHTLETSNASNFARACVLQAVGNLLCSFLQAWALFACFCELWVRVVLAAKDVTFYRYFYFWGLLVVTIMLFLVALLYGEPEPVGGGGSLLTCSWGVADSKLNFKLQTVPMLIFFFVELFISFHVMYQCVKVSMQVHKKGTNPLASLWKSYRTLFLLNIGNIITYSIVLLYFGVLFTYVYVPHIVNSTVSWMTCLFVHFTNENDTSYIEKCGGYVPPGRRYEGSEKNLAYALQYMPPVIMWIITLGADAKSMWSGILNKLSIRSSRVLASSRVSSSSSSQHIADKPEKPTAVTVRESDNSRSKLLNAGSVSVKVKMVSEKYAVPLPEPEPCPTEREDRDREDREDKDRLLEEGLHHGDDALPPALAVAVAATATAVAITPAPAGAQKKASVDEVMLFRTTSGVAHDNDHVELDGEKLKESNKGQGQKGVGSPLHHGDYAA